MHICKYFAAFFCVLLNMGGRWSKKTETVDAVSAVEID